MAVSLSLIHVVPILSSHTNMLGSTLWLSLPYRYNAVRCIFCTVLGLLLGSIYYQTGSQRTNPNDIVNIMGE